MSKRCTAFDTRYNIEEDDLILLKSIDPTGSKCLYLDFIYRQYIQGYLSREDFDELRLYLQLFEDNKSHLKEKDINTYNLISLRELFYVKLATNNVKDDINTLYDGPYGILSIPLTHYASCKLGSGTKWCTSSKENEESFHEYNDDGPLYVWYDNNWNKGTLKELGNKSKKFQFHFETATFMDEYDNNIPYDILVYFMRDHPVISLLFEEHELYMTDDSYIVKYVIRIDPDDQMGYISKYILNNTDREKLYISMVRKKYITDLDKEIFSKYLEDKGLLIKIAALDKDVLYKYIYSNTDMSYLYALQRYQSIGIEEIDRNILSNPNYTYKYLTLMNNDITYKIPSDNIVIRAIVNREKYINIAELDKIDHKAALLYVTDVLRSRCPIVEHDLEKMDKYTRLFLMPKLVPGNEETYLKSVPFLTFEDYRVYYEKYGRSDMIDKYLVDREDYHTLTKIAIYLYRVPLSCCMIHLDKDIETKAIVKNTNSMYDMYMYVFYDIGKPQDTEYILRRMLIHGESKELCNELINMKIVSIDIDGYNSLSGLTKESLKYINDNTTTFFMKILTYVYLGERPVSFDNVIKKSLDEDSCVEDLIAYSLYWEKFLGCVKMPIFENARGVYDIYLNNYKGKIDQYEKKAYIPIFYLSSRVII